MVLAADSCFPGQQEIDVITTNNQQVFVSRDSIKNAGKYLQTQATFSLRYYYRPAIRTKHFFRFSFNQLKIDSSVLVYNPNYFLNNQLSLVYPEFFYSINYNNIDYVPYPTRGFLFETSILQRGFSAEHEYDAADREVNGSIFLCPENVFCYTEFWCAPHSFQTIIL